VFGFAHPGRIGFTVASKSNREQSVNNNMPEGDAELPDEALPDEIRQSEWSEIEESEDEGEE
jgi:hypothetical protein